LEKPLALRCKTLGYFRRSTTDEVAGVLALVTLVRFCGVQNFIPTEPNAGITTVVPGLVGCPSSATNNRVVGSLSIRRGCFGGPLIQRLKNFAGRVARDNVAVPTIEYTIVFAIVMALVLMSAAYVGTWIAEKWFLLTAKLT
jgi:hypothetical protein